MNDSSDKPGGPIGRGDGQNGEGDAGGDVAAGGHCSPRKAGVVIRATVEHMGLVGDTELTVNVKWPASTFCVPQYGKHPLPPPPPPDPQVPDNGPQAKRFDALIGEAVENTEPD
jgi:hypothetical protein